MERDVVVFLLRLALTAVLYLFLLQLLVVLWRDLRQPATALQQPAAGPQLHLLDPGMSGRAPGDVIALEAVTSLGRAAQNTIVLKDPSVSAEHALISHRLGQWWIEDLGSKNGTLVNGLRLDQPTVLQTGDVIGIGAVHLRFQS